LAETFGLSSVALDFFLLFLPSLCMPKARGNERDCTALHAPLSYFVCSFFGDRLRACSQKLANVRAGSFFGTHSRTCVGRVRMTIPLALSNQPRGQRGKRVFFTLSTFSPCRWANIPTHCTRCLSSLA
jgi:hypothetical protein